MAKNTSKRGKTARGGNQKPSGKGGATAAKSGAKAKAQKKGAKAQALDDAESRRLGLRGAAPWAARHAAKHAADSALEKPGSNLYVDQEHGNAYPQSLLFGPDVAAGAQ